ncbi:SARP family transcriptional regulator [Sphaerisporangium krabiense]|uniref:DNA-binding SARP family transcriptional activator n=1 Tax=Sphaerisporangium krabiense TaxID=763782 RepID=A0A7W8ZD81_9ACTN|nr:BTAD domain-containing putative transcriptional regulator [Sphaerisporangium krabiense]MBB5631558.1 DNA-binding SARP family transcriptional activator [Sphaerisporangium krabiense]GII60972.1 SARP family transcriptional regulator [Sphaerisporangium krabiense]
MADALETIRFSLLGPLKAWRDEEEIDLGWARQQAVLAVLLLEMNRPVSVTALVDAVWGHDPPRNARSTVQTYVSRLRRVLQPGLTSNAPQAILVSTDAGYQVRGDPSELDVVAFERHLTAAQDHRERGDHEAAARRVTAALALWRGEPLGGLQGPRAEAERRRLSERHGLARELLAAIRVELGQSTEAIAELTRLIGDFPLQERPRGLLMLALYRAGRQADALAAFQDVRRLLAEELGIDPGPELRDLHERILRGEDDLAGPVPRLPAAEPVPEPAPAPAPVADEDAGRVAAPGAHHRLDRAARELALAVAHQWTAEAARSLYRPKPVRVRWSSTGRPITATASAVLGEERAARAERVDLRGDLEELVAAFRRLPARQLVILGEPGAGKTVLATLLTLGLLEAPEPGEPTPVLVPLSSWNPRRDHLHTWLAGRLVEDYPGLANRTAYGPDAAARLVSTGRVMPVLDGLDETPPGLHALAIDALDQAIAGGRPLVVTCRSTEYEKAVQHGGAILARAAVVEIEPVDLDEAITYLTARRRLGEDRWNPVADHLRAHPEGPLASALATPLMVDLTRGAYADPTGDPAELLDAVRFPGQAEIEEHLLDAFLPAAYRPRPPAPGAPPNPAPRYRPEQAERWLTFLAGHLRRRHTQDLAWWELADGLPRRTKGLVLGLPPALLSGLTGCLAAGPATGLVYGASFALAGVIAGGRGRRRGPVRVETRFRGTTVRFLSRFAIGLAVGVGLGLGWSLPLPVTLMLCAVFGLATGSHVWLDTPADATRASSPSAVLRQDRAATLSLTLSTVLTLGLFYATAYTFSGDVRVIPVVGGVFDLELAVPAGLAAALLGRSLFGRVGAVTYGLAGAAVAGQVIATTSTFAFGLLVGHLFGLAVGLAVASSRAWGAFALTRVWLAVTGRAPLRLIRFLDDAHRRGVLRQTGGVYQFRHARLQDHLANGR